MSKSKWAIVKEGDNHLYYNTLCSNYAEAENLLVELTKNKNPGETYLLVQVRAAYGKYETKGGYVKFIPEY